MKFANEVVKYNNEISRRMHPLAGNAKCSITIIKGGTKENVIPESCSILLDRRINPDESVDAVENEIRSILDRLASEDSDFKYDLKRTMVYESAEKHVKDYETYYEEDHISIFQMHAISDPLAQAKGNEGPS